MVTNAMVYVYRVHFVLHKFYILLSKISWIADRADNADRTRERNKQGKHNN